ncbi:coiled-coil domain-containing protein [Sporosarcina beigongshangi]|uniref:hypothetical protein n=1 Tax=Sporosarcina beigongshangi TaxID=2782538 RepID=UPI001939BD85|nr:hypothetical protein [Sporosarcina beigongshangi]
MISENTRRNSLHQLEQTIIYLRAELAKYKNEVNKVQSDYYYSLAEKLTYDNEQLTAEKNELTENLFRLNKELVKRTSDYKERIHLHEIQSKKQLETIDALQQTESTSMMLKQLEYRLMNHIQNATKPLLPLINQLAQANKEHSESTQDKQYVLQEIEAKNNIIAKLQFELSLLQKENDKLIAQNSEPPINTETFLQVDAQIKKLLSQSLEYEEKLATKLLALHSLEQKIEQLTLEIDEVKIFGVSGQISKVE